MASLYSVGIDGVALSAGTPKTIIELKTPSTEDISIIQLSVEFDGVTAGNTPVKLQWGLFTAAVTTITSATPGKVNNSSAASAITAGVNCTAEGAGTAVLYGGEIHRVSPTSGLIMQWPLGREWLIPVSSFWRLQVTAAQAVNVTTTVLWEE